MGTRTIIPFGPQHPVLPEPIHLDLVVEDEKVVEALPSIGFIHRGLEKLVEKREYPEMVYVIERVCGICAFGHGWGYVHTVEGLMNVECRLRAVPTHHLARDVADPQPPAVAGPDGRRSGLRERLHALLANP